MFGKTTNQVEGPKPKEHNVWGVDTDVVPNVGEQNMDTPQHDMASPEINCVRVEPHVSSDNKQLELWICLSNSFDDDIEITRIECLRQTTSPSRFLKPGENHEIQVYRGLILVDDAETKAHITYKSTASGDYHQGEYLIKYKYSQHEGVEQYIPYEFDLVRPIKKL